MAKQQTPSFVKVLGGCFSTKLRIPESFVDEFGEDLHGKVVLTSSAGNPTVVSVERGSSRCFFGSGWPSFVKDHDLREGEYLVFNFTGRKTVDVVVYDTTGCVKRNAEVQISEPSPSSGWNLQTERSPTKKPRKGMRKEGRRGVQTRRPCRRSGMRNLETGQHLKTRGGMAKGSNLKPQEAPIKTESEGGYSSGNASQGLADSFQVIYKKYMEMKMYIPLRFSEITRLAKKTTAQLQGPSGEVWPVSVISTSNQGPWKRWFCRGWPAFAAANGVAVGDRIEFNYKPEPGVVQVKINRSKNNACNDSEAGKRPWKRTAAVNGRNRKTEKFPKPRKGLKGRRGAPMKAESRNGHSSGNNNASPGLAASFQVVYKKYMQTSNHVNLPVPFSETAKLSLKDTAQLQDASGKVWPVSVFSAGKGRQKRFGGGWPAFAAANGVVVGDSIEFGYKPESGLIQVKIHGQKNIARKGSEVGKRPWKRSDVMDIIVLD